ncbi:EcsC family protein [Anaerocolumna sp. AGMB13020]|uniref:EcsC family protein n=1 Tax=Anaerocolumna sp. AGMB13020 TaxID=3081750 RepID=UPI002953BAF6|nr:EcsC family protein [Anaerocolumna sp. AGMB13020]WOO36074.1 EcsC family protein [Anaerocolumna sp. AGMB13020]
MDESKIKQLLDTCYEKALQGLPTSKSVYDLSDQYLIKYRDPYTAADKLKINQIAKCGTSGFITGLGGVITLPIAIPANISSVIYIQLRMIACIAYIGGYDPSDDEVQTMAYVCLTGSAAADILKKAGINIGEKITVNLIKKIPGAALTKINQKVGFRFLTKFGEKGAINLVKFVPLVGGVVGGGVDIVGTKLIADNAIKMFIEGKIQ